MKKGLTIFFVLMLILFVVGVALCGIGVAMGASTSFTKNQFNSFIEEHIENELD